MNEESLIGQVERLISRNRLCAEGDTVLVGLSGGPASSCLPYVLHAISSRYRLKLCAVYVNHNLRPDEIPAETAFCRSVCDQMGVPFMVESVDVSAYCREHRRNRQEAARELRYAAFSRAATRSGADRIALAHNADDQAETLFMRIARGAGPAGLSGIPLLRGNIIRPLLETGREEIERFLAGRNIVPVMDSSNLKTDYFRNMVRLKLMPVLKQSNPGLLRTITRTMEILREEERYFGIVVTKTLMKLISRKTARRIELFLTPMEGMETVILRRVLRRAIAETEGLRGIGFGHVEEIIALVREGSSGERLSLPGGIRVIRDYALLIMTSEPPVLLAEHSLPCPGEVALVGAGLVLTASPSEGSGQDRGSASVLLDADALQFPLLIRPRRKGDYFFPAGFGHRKKLQDFFVDMKVPRDERDAVPIVVSGGQIVWVAGYRSDERFRISGSTKNVVKLSVSKGKF